MKVYQLPRTFATCSNRKSVYLFMHPAILPRATENDGLHRGRNQGTRRRRAKTIHLPDEMRGSDVVSCVSVLFACLQRTWAIYVKRCSRVCFLATAALLRGVQNFKVCGLGVEPPSIALHILVVRYRHDVRKIFSIQYSTVQVAPLTLLSRSSELMGPCEKSRNTKTKMHISLYYYCMVVRLIIDSFYLFVIGVL